MGEQEPSYAQPSGLPRVPNAMIAHPPTAPVSNKPISNAATDEYGLPVQTLI